MIAVQPAELAVNDVACLLAINSSRSSVIEMICDNDIMMTLYLGFMDSMLGLLRPRPITRSPLIDSRPLGG